MTHDARFLDINRCHLGGRMDHRAALILAASLLCGSVHAGYAQLSPPPAWGLVGACHLVQVERLIFLLLQMLPMLPSQLSARMLP